MKKIEFTLTRKQLETYECILSTVATDALVLKHQVISIVSNDWLFIVLEHFCTKYYALDENIFLTKMTKLFKG